jgi:hypothetical protein
MEKENIINTVKSIISLLYTQNYEKLAELDFRRILAGEEINQAIKDYGGKITMPLESTFDMMDIYPMKDIKNMVHVDCDLWVDNEKSDLTLSVAIKNEENEYKFTIKGIRVL